MPSSSFIGECLTGDRGPPPEEQDTEHTVVCVSDASHINYLGKVHRPPLSPYMQREQMFFFFSDG
jgi:hypothetical protein